MDGQKIIIIGGGLVGASAAIALAQRGFQPCLIEAHALQVDAVPNYDDRVIALAYGSQQILQSLGLWSALAPHAQPILDIHISEQGGFGFAHLHAQDEAVPALGYVIAARQIGAALIEYLRQLEIEVLEKTQVQGLHCQADQCQVYTDQGIIQADLVIAADGDDSPIRQLMGFDYIDRPYHQNAVIANLSLSQNHHGRAFERFTSQGPMALLPLLNQRCALVWTVKDQNLAQVMNDSDQQFLQAVQQQFGWRLGRLQKVGKRSVYPLRWRQVKQTVKQRVVLVGNAAHTLHPVAGQGFNLGLRDIALLSHYLSQPDWNQALQDYAQQRQRDQWQIARWTDSLVKLFSNDLSPLRFARNLGLLGFDLCPPVKHYITQKAMGLRLS